MNVYESIMQYLIEATVYQGKIKARKAKLTIKPVDTFNTDGIKQFRRNTGLNQVIFAESLSVPLKTVKVWEE